MVEKKRYRCLKCKFKFRLSETQTKRCPNCGSTSIEEITESQEAQKLINESEYWN